MSFGFGGRLPLFVVGCLFIASAGCRVTEIRGLASTSPSVSNNPAAPPNPQAAKIPPLSLQASAQTVNIGSAVTLHASGGILPYSYFVLEGGGTISVGLDKTMKFISPHQVSTSEILVTDSSGQRARTTVQVGLGPAVSPNDQLFSSLLGMTLIHATEAWGLHMDCSKILVGVLDTGIDYTHPDLVGNIFVNSRTNEAQGFVKDTRGWNFVDNTNDATDDHYHGTHVSGSIAAFGNNQSGVAGVCWKGSILPLKVLDDEGSGSDSDIVAGINYGLMMGVKVFNASIGGDTDDFFMKEAVEKAAAQGAVFVAAAGNEGANNDNVPSYPANYTSRNIISVAAVSPSTDKLASFSNYGSNSVHIAAPGVNILSTMPTVKTTEMGKEGIKASYDSISGTSMATPYVAGAAALLWSFEPNLTLTEVKSRILDRADVVTGLAGEVQNNRRLNIFRALYVP